MSDVLAELRAQLAGMTSDEKAKLDRGMAAELRAKWGVDTQNLPQVAAYRSAADILLYGGQAGGGKTDLLIGTAMTGGFQDAVIFRNEYVSLAGIEKRILELYPRTAWNGGDYVLRWEGVMMELGALGKPGAELSWQGRPHGFLGVDEAAQMPAHKIQFVLGWNRVALSDQQLVDIAAGKILMPRKRAILASNPPHGGEGEWLIEWFAPWLDPMFPNPARPGELRWRVMDGNGVTYWVEGPGIYELEGQRLEAMSLTFIPAGLKDNRYLRGTGYEAQLDALPEPLRTKLKTGNFMAGREDHEWQVIPSEHVDAAMARHAKGKPRQQPMTAIGADVAISIDESVLACLYGQWFDELKRKPGAKTATGPAMAGFILQERRGTAEIAVDMGGGYGMATRDHLAGMSISVNEMVPGGGAGGQRDKSNRYTFKNNRALWWWRFREALDPASGEDVALPLDPRLKAQLTAARWKAPKAEIVIESKDDIRGRLGSSTDDADAVIMAWAVRHRFTTKAEAAKLQREADEAPRDPLDDW